MENFCNICPRNCNVSRGETFGFCKSNNKPKVAKVMLHYFEEPPISGPFGEGVKPNGSGAVFFSGCNLKCVFCQNEEISHMGVGKEISVEKLADIFRQLESAGANNINLVTPTHWTEQIMAALKIYRPKIPIVWNTSGYEKPETILKLKGVVDIFLTDFKYFDAKLAAELSGAKDYPEFCKKSILAMREVAPEDVFEDGIMKKGMIVRHLVLPEHTDDSLNIIDWIYDKLGSSTIVSLMSQYVPTKKTENLPGLNRKIKPIEYKVAVRRLNKLGFKNAFIQDLSSADDAFIPDFLEENKNFDF